ncbi:uncharacterized protein BKA55DRAFT_538183 [Fusarium redolens]|uniref:Uncharacterized protein n=1 Tax=Fusarium redolens TaxID=48865 RepID=A0A9P9KC67_FUSRE|nr:uncharacterized protein BKA55DRAFT_538183 [Fusarium redolens]KAH7255808.1 hypothetical protein BKA55DRAFT_538183 [Fusarium redolens]
MDLEDDVKVLQKWCQEQQPLTIDIVGDFAGQELFVNHGESLMRHCLTEARVDFNDCNFDVVLSRELQNIFAHAHGPKYELTRRILISILTNQVSISIQLSLIPSRAGKVFMSLLNGTKNALRKLSIDLPDLAK